MNQRRTVIGFLAACLTLGVIGAAAMGEVVLLRMAEPRTAGGRAWRLFALTALTTGILAGSLAGAAFAVLDASGGDSAAIVGFAFLEAGAVAGFVGLAAGALVGAVVALDGRHRDGSREVAR